MQPLLIKENQLEQSVIVAPAVGAIQRPRNPRVRRHPTWGVFADQLQSFVCNATASVLVSSTWVNLEVVAPIVHVEEIDERSTQLARGFANLLTFTLEPDQPTEEDVTPRLDYRFPDR